MKGAAGSELAGNYYRGFSRLSGAAVRSSVLSPAASSAGQGLAAAGFVVCQNPCHALLPWAQPPRGVLSAQPASPAGKAEGNVWRIRESQTALGWEGQR